MQGREKRLCHRHQNPKKTTANAKEERGYIACPFSERFAFPFSPALCAGVGEGYSMGKKKKDYSL